MYMKNKILQLGLFTSLLLIMVFTSCKKDNGGDNGDGGDGGSKDSTNKVSIANFNFSPSSLMVTKGATVTWTNNDSAPHTVTADDGSFTSGTLNQGDTYSHTFDDAGTINYHCSIHPMMKASVMVH
jgi:plastocyanin